MKKASRRYCPTRKPKHFNDAWAQIAARDAGEKYGSNLRTYKCSCGWWHVYDRIKARRKDNARESRSARRARRRQEIRKEKEKLRELRREQRRQFRRERALALQTWEGEGGACST